MKTLLTGIVCLTLSVYGFSQKGETPPEWLQERLNPTEGRVTNFDCDVPIETGNCNLIPNPKFKLVDPAGAMLAAFNWDNVINWGYTSSGTADINAGGDPFFAAPTLPAAISGFNYASLLVVNMTSPGILHAETIAAKTGQVLQGKRYALSFFLSSTLLPPYPATNPGQGSFTFKVILTKCQEFPNADNYPLTLTDKQEIFCRSFVSLGASGWNQYFVDFVADDDYDMILVYPDAQASSTGGSSYVHFAYPQLIKADDYAVTVTPSGTCGVQLSADADCGIANSVYTWKDPFGNTVGTGQQLTVNPAIQGEYVLSVTVPTAVNPGSSCSNNGPSVKGSGSVVLDCACYELQIQNATVQFDHWDPLTGLSNGSYTQTLETCEITNLCYNKNEYLNFSASSNQVSGNQWQFLSSNPALVWYPFVYSTGSATSQSFTGFLTINPNESGVIEIRLTNTVISEVKSIYVRVVSRFNRPQWWCNSLNPAYDFRITGMNNDPSFSFTWSFPAGMTVSSTTAAFPNFSFGSYSGTFPVNATCIVSSPFCPSFTEAIPLQEGDPSCSARTAIKENPNSILSAEPGKFALYPNPVKSAFTVVADKKIREVSIYSIDGKMIKRFAGVRNKQSFDISELPSGLLLVQMIFEDHSMKTETIVKH